MSACESKTWEVTVEFREGAGAVLFENEFGIIADSAEEANACILRLLRRHGGNGLPRIVHTRAGISVTVVEQSAVKP